MTVRAIILGFLMGLFIAGYTYFNDHVAHQGQLIGSFMPIAVFGLAVVTVLVGNPLLARAGMRMLNAGELAVAAAIALSVCGFPGSNFHRYFGALVSQPGHLRQTQTVWRADNVFSYLPGGEPTLAPGQVADWPTLVERVAAREPGFAALYDLAGEADRSAWQLAFAGQIEPGRLTRAINDVLADPRFAELPADTEPPEVVAASRQRLQGFAAGLIAPPPTGDAGLLIGGRSDPRITEPLVTGSAPEDGAGLLGDVPWAAWRRPIALWVGLAVMLGVASLGLALIFHPQWSRRELLAYPVARVITDLGRRTGGSALPDLARSPMFWAAFAVPFAIHVLNGLHAWYPVVPEMSLRLNFNPLRQLFPLASRSAQSYTAFNPLIIPSVVAFGFLLNRSVSFTLGIANYVFVAVGAVFIANGMEMAYSKFTPDKNNMIRLGSYLGLAVMMAYAGRRYYWHVVVSAVAWRRFADTPAAATWGARACAALALASTWLVSTSGLSWWLSAVLVGLSLLVWVVTARVVAETGMILMSGPFLPLGVLPALLGPEALGPSQAIVLGIAGSILLIDPKEAVLPFLVNGLQMGERTGVRVARLAWPMLAMMVIGMTLATWATVSLQYRFGVDMVDGYATLTVPSSGFNEAVRVIDDLKARGALTETVARTSAEQLAAIRPDPAFLGWVGVGLALVIATGLLSLRVPRWPIHPVLFIVWGVWGIAQLGFSMLLGWLLNVVVTRIGGLRAYRTVQPAVFGVIAGELSAGLMWKTIAAASFAWTGQTPPHYAIFP